MSGDLAVKWNVRLAEPSDAQSFADWASHNQHIDQADLKAGMMKTNPTVLTFVVEKDGEVVWFAPVYLAAVIAHMCPNPDAEPDALKEGLSVLKDGVAAFMAQYGPREILTLTYPKYPIAKWALANGFEMEPRNLLRLDINREMASTEA